MRVVTTPVEFDPETGTWTRNPVCNPPTFVTVDEFSRLPPGWTIDLHLDDESRNVGDFVSRGPCDVGLEFCPIGEDEKRGYTAYWASRTWRLLEGQSPKVRNRISSSYSLLDVHWDPDKNPC